LNFELYRLGTKSGEKIVCGDPSDIGLISGVYLLASLKGTPHVVLGRWVEDEVRRSVSSKVNQLKMPLVRT